MDLNNLLKKLRVLENRERNPYFTKYNDFSNLKSNLFDYSFIYIQLHIKNYLSNIKYYVLIEELNYVINYMYTNGMYIKKR
jgi:hypothetical protein